MGLTHRSQELLETKSTAEKENKMKLGREKNTLYK